MGRKRDDKLAAPENKNSEITHFNDIVECIETVSKYSLQIMCNSNEENIKKNYPNWIAKQRTRKKHVQVAKCDALLSRHRN